MRITQVVAVAALIVTTAGCAGDGEEERRVQGSVSTFVGTHAAEASDSHRGTVKWYSQERGFGYITPDDGAKDLFVHHSGILGTGSAGLPCDRVTYQVSAGSRGPSAVQVACETAG